MRRDTASSFFFWIHRDCACGGLVCLFRLSVCCFFCSFRSCFTMLAFSCELIPRSVVHHSCLLIVITDSCSPTDLASAHSASTPHTSPQPNPLANPSPPLFVANTDENRAKSPPSDQSPSNNSNQSLNRTPTLTSA